MLGIRAYACTLVCQCVCVRACAFPCVRACVRACLPACLRALTHAYNQISHAVYVVVCVTCSISRRRGLVISEQTKKREQTAFVPYTTHDVYSNDDRWHAPLLHLVHELHFTFPRSPQNGFASKGVIIIALCYYYYLNRRSTTGL